MNVVYSKMEKAVGVFVIGIAVLLLVTVVLIGRGKDWFRKYVIYTTAFEESYGIEPDTPVKLYKTDVGKVKKISLVGDHVEVTLAIQEEYASRITSGTRVTVESPTLIGSEFVSIKPGSLDAPPIPEGGVIPSKARRSLNDIMTEFEVEKTARRLTETIQNVADMTGRLKDPNGPLFMALQHIDNTTAHLEKLAGDVHQGQGTVGNLLRSRELIDTLEKRIEKLDDILTPLADAAAKTPAAMDKVQENLDGIGQLETEVGATIAQIRDLVTRIDAAVQSLQATLNRIEEASRDVPPITRSARESLQKASDSMDEIDRIVEAVQQNFLVRPNLPQGPEKKPLDSGLRR